MVKKIIREIDLSDFTSFLAWTFLNFLAYCDASCIFVAQDLFKFNFKTRGPKGTVAVVLERTGKVLVAIVI